MTTASSLRISQKAKLVPIDKVAHKLGISGKYLIPHGSSKCKISLEIMRKLKSKKRGKYILVTGITPTPYGEGKTVAAIGLSMALARAGKKAACCLTQPSLGPMFSVKGCGTGGGLAQVVPMEDINFYLTGDTHVVGAAHNLCAAYLDNSLYRGNPLGIVQDTISWNRVIDVNDRFLRKISIGMGTKRDGINRRSGFDSTASSELMDILALSEDIAEVRDRIGRINVAFTDKKKPVTADDIKAAGAMTALVRDALMPNLVQTLEGTPCFMHVGSFASTAMGSGSIIADKMALGLCDYVVTECGFGADLGAEKFFDIKCRRLGFGPDAAVLVLTIRTLKMHSGDFEITVGKAVESLITRENISAVERGSGNLHKQIENIKCFGVPVVVCINRLSSDTEKEIEAVKRCAMSYGADACCVIDARQNGGPGAAELASCVADVVKRVKPSFRYLYPVDLSIKDKVTRIAKTIFGAKEAVFPEHADERIKLLKKLKLDALPICMMKTPYSLSHEPKRKGRPRNFKLPVTDLYLASGAGYICVPCGDVSMMEGLPAVPRGTHVDIDKNMNIVGL
ncbi:MAG: formate--tetrahydrofolate ligase [Candidatus Omnitrophota bacterium]